MARLADEQDEARDRAAENHDQHAVHEDEAKAVGALAARGRDDGAGQISGHVSSSM